MAGFEVLKVAEDLLKKRREVFARIKAGENLTSFILNANLCTIIFAASYGATMESMPGRTRSSTT